MSKNKAITFKSYHQNQPFLLPPSLDELIPRDHPVRVVNEVIDSIDITPLEGQYSSVGSSSYHPKMLLKVLVYGYVTNIYSSRKIESSLKENIHFMWLSAMNTPDHNTINRFRSERLKEVLRTLFVQIVQLLASEGLLSLKEISLDGTKIEANANRYTFVWGKAIKTNKEKMAKQLDELWQYAQKVAEQETDTPEPPDFTKIDKQKVEQTIAQIDALLADKKVDKKIEQKLNYAKKNYPKAIEKYEAQEKLLAGRNSYSKTDTDATFMRMKEDHLQNGQLKPGYNVQVSASNQYVVEYTIHPNPTDTTTLPTHLEQYNEDYKQLPEEVTADAGYGSEQNYQYLEDNHVAAYVKYNHFNNQLKKNHLKKNPFAAETLYYNAERDCYYCSMAQPMNYIGTIERKTSTGFTQTIKKYQAQNCNGCPLRGVCHDAKANRTIEINHNLNRHKQIAYEKLTSEEGIQRRKKRCVEVEPIFGNIKNNHHFKRFMLRGKAKVEIEFGLLAIAQNLRKKAG